MTASPLAGGLACGALGGHRPAKPGRFGDASVGSRLPLTELEDFCHRLSPFAIVLAARPAWASADRKLPNRRRIVLSLGVIPVAVHASAVGRTPNSSKKARIEASASSSRSSEESRSS